MRSARHGIEREFAFERFVSQEFSTRRRCRRCRVSIALHDRILPTPIHLSSNSSKIAGDNSVKGVALSKLQRSNASRHW
jgi:hypothetical protein